LTNGLEVRFPLHFSAEVLAVVRAGDRVTVYGGTLLLRCDIRRDGGGAGTRPLTL
jgi:hypothetical protein